MYSDVLPFFRALRASRAGRHHGVLANQEAGVIDALRRDGLGDLIDVWGISAVAGYQKPSPELFTWCLDRAGVTATEAVHIGNRLDTDVRPAKALGMHAVWVLRGEAPSIRLRCSSPNQTSPCGVSTSLPSGRGERRGTRTRYRPCHR